MDVAIVKYNAGNIQSVLYALDRLHVKALVTDDIAMLKTAPRVIFPGVGAAKPAMDYLKDRGLDEVIINLTQPVLGICLGLQLMCKHSEEGDTPCLGIFDTQVYKFTHELKIPHMGWNTIQDAKMPLFANVKEEAYCYFVHSYYAGLCAGTIASTSYGKTFSSALHKNNFYGVQFHPEKSSDAGQQILKNFLAI